MKKSILISVLFLSAFAVKIYAQYKGGYKFIQDWSDRQPESPNYEFSLEKKVGSDNQNKFTIESIKSKINGFGTFLLICGCHAGCYVRPCKGGCAGRGPSKKTNLAGRQGRHGGPA